MGGVRVVIVVFSAIVCAWFVLVARQAHEMDRADTILSLPGAHNPAQLREVTPLLASAAGLNPDREVDVLRARVRIDQKRLPAARVILDAVVRDEPMNLEGWIWLGGASFGNNAVSRLVGTHIQQLDPIDARQN